MRFLLLAAALVLTACAEQPAGVPPTVSPVPQDLDALTKRVVDDMKYWDERGVRISSVGPDAERGVVVVRLPDPAKATELPAHYGGRVVVEEGGPIEPA